MPSATDSGRSPTTSSTRPQGEAAKEGPLRILSFDAGITHVGMVEATVRADWSALKLVRAACIDLADVRHDRVPRDRCTLCHTNALAHRFAHFVQEHAPSLEAADVILVEQQPPGSAGQPFEQMLLLHAGARACTVHPRSMHQRLGVRGDYEERKIDSVKIASSRIDGLREAMDRAVRPHDIADAGCLLLFECERRAEEARRAEASRAAAERAAEWRRDRREALRYLWSFAYTGPGSEQYLRKRPREIEERPVIED